MTPQRLSATTFALAFVRWGLSVPPYVEKAEVTVSSITNSNKTSSDESYDDSISPAKAYSDHKRKTDERFTDVPRHTYEIASHSPRPISNSSLAAPMNKKQKISNKKNHNADGQAKDEVFAAGMDPTTTEGQLALNPNLTEAKAKVAAKREYNCCNAARARKRSKNTVVVLQERVSCLTKRTDKLSRSNDVLKTQVDVLKTQNRELMVSRSVGGQPPTRSVCSYASSSSNSNNKNNIVSELLNALQKRETSKARKRHFPATQGTRSWAAERRLQPLFAAANWPS